MSKSKKRKNPQKLKQKNEAKYRNKQHYSNPRYNTDNELNEKTVTYFLNSSLNFKLFSNYSTSQEGGLYGMCGAGVHTWT